MSLEKEYNSIKDCRICGSKDIITILSLGKQPLANSLTRIPVGEEGRYPLTLAYCKKCSMVQLKETVNKEILFDNYVWVTGTSASVKEYADVFYKRAANIAKIKPGDLVVEIASNDGTFLKPFAKGGYRVIGVEPAKNIADLSRKSGIETANRYWGLEAAARIKSDYGQAKIIIARNVIPHVSELKDVIYGIGFCMAEDGIGIIEFHYSGKILEGLHYDSIYHEHLCYFSIKTMEYLLNKFGLFPFHIYLSPISGGSYVIYFSKTKRKKSAVYIRLENKERKSGVSKLSSWKKFADKCKEHREKSRQIVGSFQGRTIMGFGASARSSTYLNFCGFTNSDIKAVIDNNRLKQGFFSAGSSIPIVSIKEGFEMSPDILFLLAWNFRDEIIKECKSMGYRGDFIIPFPKKPYLFKKEMIK